MIRVWKSIKWQLQVVFYEIRTAAAFFIILNGLLLILPLSACRVIDKKAAAYGSNTRCRNDRMCTETRK